MLRYKLTPAVLRAVFEFMAAHEGYIADKHQILDLILAAVNGTTDGTPSSALSRAELGFVIDRLNDLGVDVREHIGRERDLGPTRLPVDLLGCTYWVPLGVDRSACILCDRPLPTELMELALDSLKGDGSVRRKRAVLTQGAEVLCADGCERRARHYYKRCHEVRRA